MKNILQRLLYMALLFFFFPFLTPAAIAQTPRDYGFQVGYGYSVGASLVKGDTMFIGGDFDYVGLYTGSMVSVDRSTGTISKSFPVVNGTIQTMISDGSGGYYIGGNFTEVNGYSRIGLAHITNTKALDLAWNINVDNGTGVYALALSTTKDTLWVGGTFNSIGGVAKDKIAAIKVSTRTVLASWGPGSVNKNWWAPAIVCALLYRPAVPTHPGDVSRLIIGGDFQGFNWTTSKANVAALDPLTGAVLTNWKADVSPVNGTTTFTPVSPIVRSLATYNFYLYIGGLFKDITDKRGTAVSRQSIAALNVEQDTLISQFSTNLQPQNDSGLIDCIKLVQYGASTYLGIGGKFRNAGNKNVQNFTLVDYFFGTPWPVGSPAQYVNGRVVDTTFTPGVYASGEVYNFDTTGTTVLLAGDFEGIQSSSAAVQIRRNLAALDMSGNVIGSWAPSMQTNMPVKAIAISGTEVHVGGSFTSAGGQYRKNVAAVDLSTNSILPFNPSPDSYVNAFELSQTKDTLYMGGNFSNIGTSKRGYCAAIDLRTNTLLPWLTTTGVGGGIQDIKLDTKNKILYVGGKFTNIGGKVRNHLAAINALTGNVVNNWVADVATINSNITPVRSLAYDASSYILYVGGRFNTIAGQSRANLAALTTNLATSPADTTASLLSWNIPVTPTTTAPDIGLNVLKLNGGRLYVGGKFDAINGNTAIKNVAAINILASPNFVDASWAPDVQGGGGGVNAIVPDQNVIYLAGDFGTINGVATSNAGAVSITDGSIVSAWMPYPTKPPLGGIVLTLSLYKSMIYMGGSQEAMTQNINDAVFHLATLPGFNPIPLPVDLAYFTVDAVHNEVLVKWQVLTQNATVEVQRSTDGINFTGVDKEAYSGAGTFTDKNIIAGQTYYYRLKLMGDNGQYTYSTVKMIAIGKEASGITAYARSDGNIQLNVPEAGFNFQLFTSGGQCVKKQTLASTVNLIPVHHVAKGLYFFSISGNGYFRSGSLFIP